MNPKHLIAILLVIGCQPLCAATVGLHFEATISGTGINAADEPAVAEKAWFRELREHYGIGVKVSGDYFYDSDVAPSASFVDGSASEKRYPLQSVNIAMKGFSAHANGRDITVSDSFSMGYDQYVVFSIIDNDMRSSGTLAKLFAFGLGLYDPTGTVLTNSALPTVTPNLADYVEGFIDLDFAEDPTSPHPVLYALTANLDSLTPINPVPLPPTVLMLISGLGMLGVLKGLKSSKDPD